MPRIESRLICAFLVTIALVLRLVCPEILATRAPLTKRLSTASQVCDLDHVALPALPGKRRTRGHFYRYFPMIRRAEVPASAPALDIVDNPSLSIPASEIPAPTPPPPCRLA